MSFLYYKNVVYEGLVFFCFLCFKLFVIGIYTGRCVVGGFVLFVGLARYLKPAYRRYSPMV